MGSICTQCGRSERGDGVVEPSSSDTEGVAVTRTGYRQQYCKLLQKTQYVARVHKLAAFTSGERTAAGAKVDTKDVKKPIQQMWNARTANNREAQSGVLKNARQEGQRVPRETHCAAGRTTKALFSRPCAHCQRASRTSCPPRPYWARRSSPLREFGCDRWGTFCKERCQKQQDVGRYMSARRCSVHGGL